MSLFFISIGTAKYQNPEFDLPSVESDVKAISTALESLGFQKVIPHSRINPTREELNGLEEWFNLREPEDEVVLYYVGHGHVIDQHYLLLQQGSKFASLDLVRTFALQPKARHILFLLDTCESGDATLDLAEHWKLFEDFFISAKATLAFVSSCRSKAVAQNTTFTPAFAKALRTENCSAGRNQRCLHLSDILDQVKADLPDWQKTSASSFPFSETGRVCFDFPNPGYKPELPVGLDLESQRRLIERQAHWDDRIRHFTGRKQALSDIKAFLEKDQGGILVVTGGPGCGKSSVIAHFVIEEKSINLPIHTKGRNLDQMTQIIGSALDIPLPDQSISTEDSRAKALACAVKDSGKRVTLVVDALDEALRPDEITRGLLAELGKCPNVWLLIGSRPDTPNQSGRRFEGLGSMPIEIDLDSDRYFAPEDIETYARQRLLEAGPYHVDESLACEAARAVAGKAACTFLIAKLECDGLVTSKRALNPDEIWRSKLPVDIKTAFEEYLYRFPDETTRQEICDVLAPLAFAFGQGLPSGAWEKIACALSEESITSSRIQGVLEKTGAYVVESVEDDRSVYRLFHEKFAEFFRDRALDLAESHSRIVSALLPANWIQASFYARRYLALHAAAAGRLDELLEVPAFLVAAEPTILRRVVDLAKGTQAARNGDVYSVVSHFLGSNLPERASSLALAAIKFGYPDLAADFQAHAGCPWLPRAAQWQISPYLVIKKAHDAVRALAFWQRNGRPVIASAGDDELIRIWDLETLESIGNSLDINLDINQVPDGDDQAPIFSHLTHI